MWVVVDNNCGTGAGGFKKGNTCWRTTYEYEDKDKLVRKIGLKGSEKVPSYDLGPNVNVYRLDLTDKGRLSENDRPQRQMDRMMEVTKKLRDSGFIQITRRDRFPSGVDLSKMWTYYAYEHPSGHRVEVIATRTYEESPTRQATLSQDSLVTRNPTLEVRVTHVPKSDLVGFDMSRDALEDLANLKPSTQIMEKAREAFTNSIGGNYRKAIDQNREVAGLLNKVKSKNPQYKKIAELYNMAADWYMDKLGVSNTWRLV